MFWLNCLNLLIFFSTSSFVNHRHSTIFHLFTRYHLTNFCFGWEQFMRKRERCTVSFNLYFIINQSDQIQFTIHFLFNEIIKNYIYILVFTKTIRTLFIFLFSVMTFIQLTPTERRIPTCSWNAAKRKSTTKLIDNSTNSILSLESKLF